MMSVPSDAFCITIPSLTPVTWPSNLEELGPMSPDESLITEPAWAQAQQNPSLDSEKWELWPSDCFGDRKSQLSSMQWDLAITLQAGPRPGSQGKLNSTGFCFLLKVGGHEIGWEVEGDLTGIRGDTCKYDQNTLNSQGMNKTIIQFFLKKCSLSLLAHVLHCSQLVLFPSPLPSLLIKICVRTLQGWAQLSWPQRRLTGSPIQ